MKTLLAAALFVSAAVPAFAADTDANPAYDQARQDYKIYMQELKKLSQQYRELTGEMQKVINEEGYPSFSEDGGIDVVKPGQAAPAAAGADVKESGKEVTVQLDLPGLDRKDLKVSIENQKTLRVRGKRKATGEAVERLIALPSAAEGAQGQYEDGVLTVKAKKAPETKTEVAVPVR